MNILIADDEAPARARLAALLRRAGFDYRPVAEAANGAEVLAVCADQQIDLVLLDIRMPGMDGIETALELARRPSPPAVVFVTAYDEHALDAFDANAIDYLLKPVRTDRLVRALGKAAVLSGEQQSVLAGTGAFIGVSYRGAVGRVPASRVIFLRADKKYVEVWSEEGMALTEESLRAIVERMSDRFMRVHRNALVSPARVRELQRDALGNLVLKLDGTDETVDVSRRHAADVRRLLRAKE